MIFMFLLLAMYYFFRIVLKSKFMRTYDVPHARIVVGSE